MNKLDPKDEDYAKKLDNMFYQDADTFFPSSIPDALTFDDISLKTCYSEILPSKTNPTIKLSKNIELATPIISADMDTVTESDTAIAMALNGGLGVIHCNMSPEQQIEEVSRVKNHGHGVIENPVTMSQDQTIGDVLKKIEEEKYDFSTFPIVDEYGKLVGLLKSDVVEDRFKDKKIEELMRTGDKLKTLNKKKLGKNYISAANKFFDENAGKNKILIIDDKRQFKGMITKKDINNIIKESRSPIKPTRDPEYRLQVAASIKTGRPKKETIEHIQKLVSVGVDAVCISTAHGFTEGVGNTVEYVKDEFKDLTIIAGNVTSAEGVKFLADKGADIIKIGQGPGSICTTRKVAGVGISQMTALFVCSKIAKILGVKIISDGGIKASGDMAKALTLGDVVMCGGIFGGCDETPGEIIKYEGIAYKEYRGMGSKAAYEKGSAERYGYGSEDKKKKNGNTDDMKEVRKITPEGVEALKKSEGPIEKVITEFRGGIQASMGYLGAENMEIFKKNARYVRMTPAGETESKPHDLDSIKKDS